MKKTVRKTAIEIAAFILAVVTAMLLFGCAPEPEQGEIINAEPANGETVPILPELLRKFYTDYESPGSADMLYNLRDIYKPIPVKLSWTCEGGADYYVVGLSLNKDIDITGSEGTEYFVTVDNSVEAIELFCGKTYYYRVFAVRGEEALASVYFSFKTEDYLRTVSVGGVSNTRDLGGKTGTGGKKIKQGIIYRGANVDGVTKQGKVDFLEKLGIKTEIDLRTGTEISVFHKNINVVSVKAPMYTDNSMGINNPDYMPELAKEIKVFADPESYPIYFHCAIGRDRTGTLACLIQMLAGVDQETIEKDFVASFFSEAGSADGALPSSHVNNLRNIFKFIDNYSNGSRMKNLEKFLNDIGVTNEEIKAIRANIMED